MRCHGKDKQTQTGLGLSCGENDRKPLTTHITFWTPPAAKKEPRKTKDRWSDDLDSFIKR